jgi:hypothetical protein
MKTPPDFKIISTGPVSREFTSRNIFTFLQAAEFVEQLPYKRNSDKLNLITVFTDNCATCSTKHALLKKLADENHFEGISLVLGLFKMSAQNTPAAAGILNKYKLDYIPEAHNYLRYEGALLDYTGLSFAPGALTDDLLMETTMVPEEIGDFKVNYQKDFMKGWLQENPHITYSHEEVWKIREECIAAFSANSLF